MHSKNQIYLKPHELRQKIKEADALFENNNFKKCTDMNCDKCRKSDKSGCDYRHIIQELKKKFESYYNVDLATYVNEDTGNFEIKSEFARLYSIMIAMIRNRNNCLSSDYTKSLSEVKSYNDLVFAKIENLDPIILDYITSQPCYKYNFFLSQYGKAIIERISVLANAAMNVNFVSVENTDDVFYTMVTILDNTIDKLLSFRIAYENNSAFDPNNEHVCLDALFGDIFNALGWEDLKHIENMTLQQKPLDENTFFDLHKKLLELERKHMHFQSSLYLKPYADDKAIQLFKTKITKYMCRILDMLLILGDNHPKFYRECFGKEFQESYNGHESEYKKDLEDELTSLNATEYYDYLEVLNYVGGNMAVIESNIKETESDEIQTYEFLLASPYISFGQPYFSMNIYDELLDEIKESVITEYGSDSAIYLDENLQLNLSQLPDEILDKKSPKITKKLGYLNVIAHHSERFYERCRERGIEIQEEERREKRKIEEIIFLLMLEQCDFQLKLWRGDFDEIKPFYKLICTIVSILNIGDVEEIHQRYSPFRKINPNAESEPVDTEILEIDKRKFKSHINRLEMLKKESPLSDKPYDDILNQYAGEIVTRCIKSPAPRNICTAVYSQAETFYRQYMEDKNKKIKLYNEYAEKGSYLIDEFLGYIYSNNATKDMNINRILPPRKHKRRKDNNTELMELVTKPCKTKEELDNLIRNVYTLKAEEIVKAEAEEYIRTRKDKKTLINKYNPHSINTELGTFRINKPELRNAKFKSKFLDSYSKFIFDIEIATLIEKKYSVSEITEIIEIFSKKLNIDSKSRSTIGNYIQELNK